MNEIKRIYTDGTSGCRFRCGGTRANERLGSCRLLARQTQGNDEEDWFMRDQTSG